MFKHSTIIWQKPISQKNFFAEKRLIHAAAPSVPIPAAGGTGIKASLLSGWRKVTAFGGGVKDVITSKPVRWTLFPGTMVVSTTYKAAKWSYEKAERFARFGVEAGMGVKEATFDPAWRLVQAPLIFVKKNLLDNTLDGTRALLSTPFTVGKGLLKTPGNILRFPKNLFLGIKEAISNTRKEIGNTLKHATELSPLKTIDGIRKSVWSLLKAPFTAAKAPLSPLIYEPAKEVIEPHKKVITNIKDSLMAYPKSIYSTEAGREGATNKLINGVRRIINAWATTATPAAAPAAA